MALFPLKDDTPLKSISFQYVTVTLIAINVVLFLWELVQPDQEKMVYALGAIPAVVFGLAELPDHISVVPGWASLFTSLFLHGGWMHLLGNMLFLWIFGDNVEDSMGHLRYLVFYLLCGVLATLMHAIVQPPCRNSDVKSDAQPGMMARWSGSSANPKTTAGTAPKL